MVPAINKSCTNTELPWGAHAVSCCKRWDEGNGRAEATAMGFDVLILQRYLRSSLRAVSHAWGASANREVLPNARLG